MVGHNCCCCCCWSAISTPANLTERRRRTTHSQGRVGLPQAHHNPTAAVDGAMDSAPDSPPASEASQASGSALPIDELEELIQKYTPTESDRQIQAMSLKNMNPEKLMPNTMATMNSAADGMQSKALADVIQIAKWITFYGGKTATDLVELAPPDHPRRQHALEFYEAWTRLAVGLDVRLAAAVEEHQNALVCDLDRYLS